MEQSKGSGLVRVRASLRFGDVNITTIERRNEPMVLAAHVVRALGYAGDNAVTKFVSAGELRQDVHYVLATGDDLRALKLAGLVGRNGRSAILLTERGVYRLLLLSKMPRALEFQDWVEGTLIPQAFRAIAPEAPTEPYAGEVAPVPEPVPPRRRLEGPQPPARPERLEPGERLRLRIRQAIVDAPLEKVVAVYELLFGV